MKKNDLSPNIDLRVAEEAAKLVPEEERTPAEEGLAAGSETWPAYREEWSF